MKLSKIKMFKKYIFISLTIINLYAEKNHDSRNTMNLRIDDTIVQLYKVTDERVQNNYVAFLFDGNDIPKNLEARDESMNLIWKKIIFDNALSITGGFDFNADGWPDLATIVRGGQTYDRNGNPNRCGSGGKDSRQLIKSSFLVLYNGKTGEEYRVVKPLDDYCFPNTNDTSSYIVRRYYNNSIIFGEGTNTIVISPDYNGYQWYYTFDGMKFKIDSLVFHSNQQFDEYYRKTDQYWGTSYKSNLNGINGLLIENGRKYVLFSYGRLFHYKVMSYNKEQLLMDVQDLRNFIEKGRYAYRTKGKIQIDPNYNRNIALIGGTNALNFFRDNIKREKKSDPYGGLHRRFLLHNFVTMDYKDRFFSQTDATHKQSQYDGRIVYPSNIFLKVNKGDPSRVIYNIFKNEKWHIHISKTNNVDDEKLFENQFVWDVIDIDNDKLDEIIISPTDPNNPYFVKNITNIYHWDEKQLDLTLKNTFNGIPNISSRFPNATTRDSRGYLSPVQVIYERGKPNIVLYDLSLFEITNVLFE